MNTFQIQSALQSLGYNITMLDGVQGPETTQAIKDFQYTWGNLDVDGIVGPMTTAALEEAVQLLIQNQWNVSMDPQQYVSEPLIGGSSTVPPFLQAQTPIITTTTQTPLQASILGDTIDWKWIVLGVGAAMMIFRMMRK
jgi:peptidoglycan hydrolase-like protein with peptidoglycan-binding domain